MENIAKPQYVELIAAALQEYQAGEAMVFDEELAGN